MVEKKEEVLVWNDKTGKYKMGYSQYLQTQILKTDRLLLIAVIILIVILLVGFYYGWELIQRIDALDVVSKLAVK